VIWHRIVLKCSECWCNHLAISEALTVEWSSNALSSFSLLLAPSRLNVNGAFMNLYSEFQSLPNLN
jgi:hypothetical protein